MRETMMLIYWINFSLLVTILHGELHSPCPDVFLYEQRNESQADKWFGVVTVGSDEDLEGVWLKIILDRKAELLGNWFAESKSHDNIAFSITNAQYTLKAGKPLLIKFFVKYNIGLPAPAVKKILLNGKTVCPKNTLEATTEPTLHISAGNIDISIPKPPTRDRDPPRVQIEDQSIFPKISSTFRPNKLSFNNNDSQNSIPDRLKPHPSPSTEVDDELFQGDFFYIVNKRPTTTSRSRPAVRGGPIKCGTVAVQAAPLISFGQATTPGQWPWHVALYTFMGPKFQYTCGGTLISDSHVITAAHCVTKRKTVITVPREKLVIYLGKHSLVSFGPEVQDRMIGEIIIHPEYNPEMYFNDIAVIKLENPVEITDFVRPCCLWEGNTNVEQIIGTKGTVVGWGFTENGELSNDLLQTQLPIVKLTTCLESNRNFFAQYISENNFCAGLRNETSVCNGDSGGAIIFPKPGTSGQNIIWQLRGVISLGVARQNGQICDPTHYAIFTDAARYLPWIKQTIRN